jgi:hypothetical protein
MLVEDTAAFIEHLRLPANARRIRKLRPRATRLELEILAAEVDLGIARRALPEMERELAELSLRREDNVGRRLLRERRIRSLERLISSTAAQVRSRQRGLTERKAELRALEAQLTALEGLSAGPTFFRLHSARHHIECSERRFVLLATRQAHRPVRVAERDGRRWWWYRGRFWWSDGHMGGDELARYVRGADARSRQQDDARRRARAAVLGELDAGVRDEEAFSQVIRLVVWCRDGGRCVDCGTDDHVAFAWIIPSESGGSDTPANVELRCTQCNERLDANVTRARVGRARLEAAYL